MIRNYLKIALRNAVRSPGFTFVNILGLSLGIASCLLISLFVKDELSFDDFHPNSQQTFRVITERSYVDRTQHGAQVPVPFGESIEGQFPEVEGVLEVSGIREMLFAQGDQNFYERNGLYTETAFFDFFEVDFLQGNKKSALEGPSSIILTEKLAIKYFGEDWNQQDILSRSIKVNNENEYRITAVLANPKDNFHLEFNYLLPISDLFRSLSAYSKGNWISPRRYCYLSVNEKASLKSLEEKINGVVEENINIRTQDLGYVYSYSLQPLEKIHLYSSHLRFDLAKKGNISHVRILVIIAIFILLLACANFINISTARANRRAKEVGLRKVSGANRSQIIFQFLSEALLTTLVALVIGAFLVEVSLGFFNVILGKSLEAGFLARIDMLAIILGIVVFSGLIAGSYTAFYISSFKPVKILKDQSGISRFARLRKILVTFQLVISVLLIMGSLVVYDQLSFVHNSYLGFDREQILVLPIKGENTSVNIDDFKSALLKQSGVSTASATFGLPGLFVQGDELTLPETNETLSLKMILADEDLVPTLGLNVIKGRNFIVDRASDEFESFLLNESAVKAAGWTVEDAIGKSVNWDIWISGDTTKRGKVVGVIKDFHFNSLYSKIEPLAIHIYRPEFSHIALKLNTNNLEETLSNIENTYAQWIPEFPFKYQFLDESFNRSYRSDSKFMILLQWFTALAVIIACLGLLGMAAYSAQYRKKEIGIRKVHGASVSQILLLINNEFLRLVILAVIIALPVGYYYTGQWLENYSYHVDLSWSQLTATAIIAMALALFTISFQTIKASLANPADTLKEE